MKRWIPILALVALAAMFILPVADESDGEFRNMYGVTFIAGEKTVVTIYVYEGDTLTYIPGVPEGYTEWDTDLTQPIYEDTVVHAIPEESPLNYGIITILAIFLMFVLWDLLAHRYGY